MMTVKLNPILFPDSDCTGCQNLEAGLGMEHEVVHVPTCKAVVREPLRSEQEEFDERVINAVLRNIKQNGKLKSALLGEC